MKNKETNGLRNRIIRVLSDEELGSQDGWGYRNNAVDLLREKAFTKLTNKELRDIIRALSFAYAYGAIDDLFNWYGQKLSCEFKKLISNEKEFLQIFYDEYSQVDDKILIEKYLKGIEISRYLVSIVKSDFAKEILFERNLIHFLSLKEKENFMVSLIRDIKNLYQLKTKASLVFKIMLWSEEEGLSGIAILEMNNLLKRVLNLKKFMSFFTKDNEAKGLFSSNDYIVNKYHCQVNNYFIHLVKKYWFQSIQSQSLSFYELNMLRNSSYCGEKIKEFVIRKMSLLAKSEQEFMRLIEIVPDDSHYMKHALESLRNLRTK